MPTSNATIEPRTTGTWYVAVSEISRHDWPNPAPNFVRVASMVLSPPRLRPPMSRHMGIGTIFELWHHPDKDDVVRTVTKATTIPGARRLFPPEWASLSKNGEPWPRHVSLLTTADPLRGGGCSQTALRS